MTDPHSSLPDPVTLWRRWSAVARAHAAAKIGGIWTIDRKGAHLDDRGGSVAHLVLVEGDRAVLFGADRDRSETLWKKPKADVTAGAPDWLPWKDVEAARNSDWLGFVRWFDDGHWWQAALPDGVDDGLESLLGDILSDDAAALSLRTLLTDGLEYDIQPHEEADVDAAARALLANPDDAAIAALLARTGTVDLAAVAKHPTEPSVVSPGKRPRGPRKLTAAEHHDLITQAMRTAVERPRPAPPSTPELERLVALLDAVEPVPDDEPPGLIKYYFRRTGGSWVQGLGGRGLSHAEHRVLTEPLYAALDALHAVETVDEASRGYGRWWFIRALWTPDGVAVERRYDSIPDWAEHPYSPTSAPSLDEIAEEFARRDQDWIPDWSALLDPEIARRAAADARAASANG